LLRSKCFLKGEKCATKRVMFESTRRDEEPKKVAPRSSDSERDRLLNSQSLVLASIAQYLQRRDSVHARICVEELSRQGPMTGGQFSVLVNTLIHPGQTAELMGAYSQLSRFSVDVEFAKLVPAFLKLTHRCLIDCHDADPTTAQRASRVLNRLLDARLLSEEVDKRLRVVVGEEERCLLQSIVAQVDAAIPGYWECAEFLGSMYPDVESLECLFSAVDQLGSDSQVKNALRGFRRSVAAIADVEFATALEFVARALGSSERRSDIALRSAAVSGLAQHADFHIDELSGFLASDDPALRLLACRVCEAANQDQDVYLGSEERETLAEQVRRIRDREAHSPPSSPHGEGALRALAHISMRQSDIEEVGAVIRARLERGEYLRADLIRAYAEGLSRIEGKGGVVSLQPLSMKRFIALDSSPRATKLIEGPVRAFDGKIEEGECEHLALLISQQRGFEEVLELCRERQDLINPRRHCIRQRDSLSLFAFAKEAIRFARHHAVLAEKGPADVAALLFPELLSVLARGRESRNNYVRTKIAEYALPSLTSLARFAAQDPRIRELAVARLSSADWEFLDRMHEVKEGPSSSSSPELALAGFAVRAAIDHETSWRDELFTWWQKLDDQTREGIDLDRLAFVAIVAERQRPGAAWELLRRVPMVSEDARAFSAIATGLLVRPADSVKRMCLDILSEKGEEIARSFRVAQLMAPYCDDAERKHLIRASKGFLDEMGVLGVDAALTLAALSGDRADALLLLEREPVSGMNESVYRVSCANAAARIVRNIERGALD
jgi:hypothetical protein